MGPWPVKAGSYCMVECWRKRHHKLMGHGAICVCLELMFFSLVCDSDQSVLVVGIVSDERLIWCLFYRHQTCMGHILVWWGQGEVSHNTGPCCLGTEGGREGGREGVAKTADTA